MDVKVQIKREVLAVLSIFRILLIPNRFLIEKLVLWLYFAFAASERIFMVHFNHLPSTTQSLVHFYHGDLLIADGVAQTNLGIEIATLCIEHIKITYHTVDVL